MLAQLSLGMWLRIGAMLTIIAVLTWSHTAAYRAGKSSVLHRLKNDRITILKDGKEIDNEVLGADDTQLCAFLGGCLPEPGPDPAL